MSSSLCSYKSRGPDIKLQLERGTETKDDRRNNQFPNNQNYFIHFRLRVRMNASCQSTAAGGRGKGGREQLNSVDIWEVQCLKYVYLFIASLLPYNPSFQLLFESFFLIQFSPCRCSLFCILSLSRLLILKKSLFK